MKEKFEKWFLKEHADTLDDDQEMDYANPLIGAMWNCWQAAVDWDKKDINGIYYCQNPTAEQIEYWKNKIDIK